MTVDYKVEHSFESVSEPTKYVLLTSNVAELILEICLYAWLIHVSFVLSSFLKNGLHDERITLCAFIL